MTVGTKAMITSSINFCVVDFDEIWGDDDTMYLLIS